MTRIVEVYSVGDPASQEHETPQSWVTSPIPTVDLAITAGVLEGKAAVGAGWDAGVIAANEGTNNVLHDYVSAYNVSLVGTVVKDCRSVGVYGYCDSEARGKISMGGESRVGHTGSHTSHSAGQRFQSGAHLACHEGFLAFVASRTRFHLNNGNGITASTPNTSSPSFFPVGLHLDLQDCEIHENGTNGIAMDASWNNGTIPVFQPAIVGGTWDEFESTTIGLPIGPPSFWLNGDEPTAGQLPSQGMGIINRCAISNNGEYGIAVRARDPGSVVACRVSNNVIWNNSLGGLLALMDRDGEFNLYPKILMPLVHNSFVENGNSGAHRNVSFIGIPPQAQNGQFTHQESSGQGGMTLNTGIYNSLLYRGSGLQEDFGNDFLALFDWNDTFVFPQPSYQIAVAGIRARVGSLGPNPYHLSIDDTSFSFAGSINAATLAGWTPAPFFLGSVNSLVWHPGPSSVNLTLRVPNLFSIGVLHNDYSNDPRDGAFVDTWEKGADEL